MRKVKVGDYEVVFSENLLVPKGESVRIDYDDGESNDFKLKIVFEEDAKSEKDKDKDEDSRKPLFSSEPSDECGVLIFKNWNKPFGSSFTKPVPFAMLDSGRELFILASISLGGDVYRANIQLMLGAEGAKNE